MNGLAKINENRAHDLRCIGLFGSAIGEKDMQSLEEATIDLEDSATDFMTQLAHHPVDFDAPMPPDLPPVAQRLWAHCQGILVILNSSEFQEIAW